MFFFIIGLFLNSKCMVPSSKYRVVLKCVRNLVDLQYRINLYDHMHNQTSNTNTRLLLPILQKGYWYIVLHIATWAYQALEGLDYIGRTTRASCPPFYLLPQKLFYAQHIWTTIMSSVIRNLKGLIHWMQCYSLVVNKELHYWVQAILLLVLYDKSPISLGSVPLKVLEDKYRSVRLVKSPISVESFASDWIVRQI